MSAILVYGNPVDGCSYIGPFEDHEAAVEYAQRYLDSDWWVTDLTEPVPEEKCSA